MKFLRCVFNQTLSIYANPWILEVSGVGWGVLLCKDFALSLKKRNKELLLHRLFHMVKVTKYKCATKKIKKNKKISMLSRKLMQLLPKYTAIRDYSTRFARVCSQAFYLRKRNAMLSAQKEYTYLFRLGLTQWYRLGLIQYLYVQLFTSFYIC